MDKGSLAAESGATGQRKGGESEGVGCFFFQVKGHFTACCNHNNGLQTRGGGGVRHKVSLLPARHQTLGQLWDIIKVQTSAEKGAVVEIVAPQRTT